MSPGRVQDELDRVLGARRLPCLEDQPLLPYTNAVLHEVQRFITLLPHVPRCTATDTELGGYLLPKVRAHSSPGRSGVGHCCCGCWGHCWGAVLQGTPVIPLLSSVLLDRTQWATPDRFNPSHFLDTRGRFVRRTAFLPFSAGARCALSPLPTQVGPRACAHCALVSPQGVVCASGRAWLGQSCSCCLLASCSGTICAPSHWTWTLPQPSPCGHPPRPCVPSPEATERTQSCRPPILLTPDQPRCWTGRT